MKGKPTKAEISKTVSSELKRNNCKYVDWSDLFNRDTYIQRGWYLENQDTLLYLGKNKFIALETLRGYKMLKGGAMATILYKDGDTMAVSTEADDEDQFHAEFCELLSDMINRNIFDGDWEFQLRFWLPQYVDICCKLRGYKSNVLEKRKIIAGQFTPNSFLSQIDERRNIVYHQYADME